MFKLFFSSLFSFMKRGVKLVVLIYFFTIDTHYEIGFYELLSMYKHDVVKWS